jgi:hypothetical protein
LEPSLVSFSPSPVSGQRTVRISEALSGVDGRNEIDLFSDIMIDADRFIENTSFHFVPEAPPSLSYM